MTGVGGMTGLILCYMGMAATGLWAVFIELTREYGTYGPFQRMEARANLIGLALFAGSFLLCGFAGGALVLLVGEKFRLLKSQEEMNEQSKPISLFSGENEDRSL